MQENKHKYDYDVTRLVSNETKPKRNPFLDNLEEREIPPLGGWLGKRELSERQKQLVEALQFMDVQKHSIVLEKRDRHRIERAAKLLGYRLTYRAEDVHGIKLYRYWVLSHTREEKE